MKKLFNLLQHLTPVFEYVGNMNQIHWSSWTATADGVIIMEIGWVTGGGGGYYYVKDITANREIAKMTTYSANGTSETRCFPVIKGHTYQVAAQAKVDGNHLNFFFYKLKLFGGGYGLTALSAICSRLAERRWEDEDSTETGGACGGFHPLLSYSGLRTNADRCGLFYRRMSVETDCHRDTNIHKCELLLVQHNSQTNTRKLDIVQIRKCAEKRWELYRERESRLCDYIHSVFLMCERGCSYV